MKELHEVYITAQKAWNNLNMPGKITTQFWCNFLEAVYKKEFNKQIESKQK